MTYSSYAGTVFIGSVLNNAWLASVHYADIRQHHRLDSFVMTARIKMIYGFA